MSEPKQGSDRLVAASDAEFEQALAHALQFDGRKTFRTAGGMMARITAAHLVGQLRRAGFVVMKGPPGTDHAAPLLNPGP
jgi:hypothetical protein